MPAGVDSKQRFSCRVAWKGYGDAPAVTLDIRDGQLVPAGDATTATTATTPAGASGCSSPAEQEITAMGKLAEQAGAANRNAHAIANEAPEPGWFDRFYSALRTSRAENARAAQRVSQFEPTTGSGKRFKALLVELFRDGGHATVKFLGSATSTEEWIRPSSWTKDFETWRSTINGVDQRATRELPAVCSGP